MIDAEERESIINETIERALLKLPEVVSSLFKLYATKVKANKKFFEDYPEFKGQEQIVFSTIEFIEGQDASRSYEEIINLAVPEIRKNLNLTKGLNMSSVSKPNTDFSHGEL